jgi:hypothetical protein
MTRAEKLGRMFADAIMESAHQRYNALQGRKMTEACIQRLQERIGELQPREADPIYKEARYGKKK